MNNQKNGNIEKGKSREWFEALVIAALVATVLRIFVVESYRIPTGSMERTLLAGDFLFVNKYVYGPKVPLTDIRLPKLHDVERGDIIVFKFPKDRSLNYIKRCVALPGDELEIRQRQMFINGKRVALPENAQFIAAEMPKGLADYQIFPMMSDFNKDNYGPIRVPRQGDVIELNGRNFTLYRDLIADEGHEVSLVGQRVYVDGMSRSTYTVQRNYYFAMGDNRDNSLDSRYWGFLPETDVVGQAMMVYWSWDPEPSLIADPLGKISSIRWGRTGLLVH
ncbi:MAG: signal peptidase I [Chlorobiaceae bacterium]|nr:signal peptidase I [Chlorobiaceae bacterium]NTW74578.1 signal peptidase I [Chlorobiaceae bacterium]